MASAQGMSGLPTLIKRLEAATQRLEEIAGSAQSGAKGHAPDHTAEFLPSAEDNSKSTNGATGSANASSDLPAAVKAFDEMSTKHLEEFAEKCQSQSVLVQEQWAAFEQAWAAQRHLLLLSTKSKKPDFNSPVFAEMIQDLVKHATSVETIKESNKFSPEAKQLSVLAGAVVIVTWPVSEDMKPTEFVQMGQEQAEYWRNKAGSESPEKRQVLIEWLAPFLRLCDALRSYLVKTYPKSLQWNSSGMAPEEALKSVQKGGATAGAPVPASPAPTGGAAPPPPPPPPPAGFFDEPASAPSQSGGGDMGAIFNQLNRGEAVTSGLRKVDKSEMTHKNPALRTQSVVPAGSAQAPRSTAAASTPKAATSKPPKKELDGNKWIVENFENQQSPIEIDAERQHSILITRCKSAVIKVNGKANAISIDNCSRLDVLVDSLVSSVDVVNTMNFRLQVQGTLPAIQLDKVDGATLYLSSASMETEIYTSKCSSINITPPPRSEAEDSVEMPIPEQIRSYFANGQLMHEIVEQKG